MKVPFNDFIQDTSSIQVLIQVDQWDYLKKDLQDLQDFFVFALGWYEVNPGKVYFCKITV